MNLLFVATDLSSPKLAALAAAVEKVRAQKSPWRFAPLLLEEEQVLRAADVFPNDFLDLVRRRVLLAGEDLLAAAEVDEAHMRYQCEYELRARLVGLRQAYLFHAGAPDKSREILKGAAQGASALHRHLLALAGQEPVEDRAGLARAVGAAYGVDPAALLAPYEARQDKVAVADAPARLGAYLDTLTALARAVDAYATRCPSSKYARVGGTGRPGQGATTTRVRRPLGGVATPAMACRCHSTRGPGRGYSGAGNVLFRDGF